MHSLHQTYHDTTMNAAFDTESWPGRGWQPPRTKGGWRDNCGPSPRPRLLLFASRSGTEAVGPPRVSAGALAPSRAASPILSTLDCSLVGSSSWVSRPSTNARRFPRAAHLAPNLRRRGRPRASSLSALRPAATEAACRAESSTEHGRSLRAGTIRENPRPSSSTAFPSVDTRSVLVEDHFRRWHHPGRCPGGDQQPPRPPGHFIAPAAWRPKSPLCVCSLNGAVFFPKRPLRDQGVRRGTHCLNANAAGLVPHLDRPGVLAPVLCLFVAFWRCGA